MRTALLDLGTNSIRLDIYEIYPDAHYERLSREKVMVRLGDEVFRTKRLHPDAMRRTIAALKNFRKHCDELCIDRERAVATSALREAENSAEFVQQIAKETGFDVSVISGKEEAELILAGILNDKRASDDTFGFIDIGGGSTEIGICQGSKTVFLDSFPLGAARLKQTFLEPKINTNALSELRLYIQSCLDSSKQISKIIPPKTLLGSSGTIRAVQTLLERADKGKKIKLKHLGKLITKMCEMPPEELAEIPGMDPARIDIIIPGAIVLQEAMVFLRAAAVLYTKFALRDGLLSIELNHKQALPLNVIKLLK